MLVAKQVADLITFSRGMLAFYLAWLGAIQSEHGLPIAVWAMIINWTGDSVDGALARHSRRQYHTWIGDHDLQIDMLVSFGLLIYMLLAGYVNPIHAVIYFLIWVGIFWRWGVLPALGMLFQAPIYGWFIWIANRELFTTGIWLVVWIVVVMVATWPKFPNVIIPGFLAGIRQMRDKE